MNAQANKDLVRQYQRIYDENRVDDLASIMADTFVTHAPIFPGLPAGIEAAKHAHQINLELFPDFYMRFEDLIAEADKVVVRFRGGGTHTGKPFFGVEPSGRKFEITGISIYRIAGGKIVEQWASEDEMGLLVQLGVLPPFDAPPK